MRNGDESRSSILDASEELFAAASFDLVSMRTVAARAGVPLGLINYHFETKEKLFEEIIARRSEELNDRRHAAFALLGPRPSQREVVESFLRPYLELMLTGGPGWVAYGRLLAQTGQSSRWTHLISQHFKVTQQLVLATLMNADPGLSKEAAARGYVHMVSVMFGMFAKSDLLSIVSEQEYDERDLKRAYDFALPFLVGAFENLADAASA